MKQKLIAIGDEGCRFATSMLDEGLFADATVDFCDNSVRRLLKYDHVDCNMTLLGGKPFSTKVSGKDRDKIGSVIGHDRDAVIIYVMSLGSRTEAKYVPEFIIEASRRNIKMLLIYSEPKMTAIVNSVSTLNERLFSRNKCAIISTSVFMQGRIVLHEHDGFNNEASRMVIEMLKREGTDFSASDVVDYCKKLRDKYPYKPDDRIVVQPDNYPWVSFEERAETYNSGVGYRRKIY